ncbi:cytochrome P450 [Crossiella cryophila]|uniref:Cytochrome P450 n=1 Tax=Crossiella cryophila TaxID=43355 RepID=A0A7W7CL32_9PSEU|nr:cytochrome P450 [Crossiella cryophila]MBB4681439.1 cytochrome P450 [Crossiella cryophila]
MLTDPRFSRAATAGRDIPRVSAEAHAVGLVALDPPQHTRHRALIAKAFTPRRAERLRPWIAGLVAELAAELIAIGPPADLVTSFANPLTHRAMAELIGVPRHDHARFRHWADVGLSTTTHTPEYQAELLGQMWDYLTDLIRKPARAPGTDLISLLAGTQDHAEADLVILVMTVLVAGYEATAAQIGNIWVALLDQPELTARLRSAEMAVPAMVEELLRWIPLEAGPAPPRYALEAVELGGVVVAAGEPVLVDITSADRDERVFSSADRVCPGRTVNPHLAFGHGPHRCIGAPLARVILQESVAGLLRALPGLCRAGPVAWRSGALVRGLTALPVSW